MDHWTLSPNVLLEWAAVVLNVAFTLLIAWNRRIG